MATTTAAPLQIKHRHTGAVLFECESGLTMRQELEKATTEKADLREANLRGADLHGANLRGADLGGADLGGADLGGANLGGANLGGANLHGANLHGADLYGADLYGADLHGADLRGADLRGADLGGANLGGRKLAGDRPVICIGPIGSRNDYLLAFLTDSGVMIRADCFFDTRAKFEFRLASTHGDNQHAQEYRAAMVLIDKHAELWTPKVDAVEPVAEVQS